MTLSLNMSRNSETSETKKDFADCVVEVRQMSGLSLAFVGDAVYELLLRTHVLSQGDKRVQQLHSMAVELANASFQASAADIIMPVLTEQEQAVYKRGRNAHPGHTPKNKSDAEYHKATGFEALFGYLYLDGQTGRISELFDMILNSLYKGDMVEQLK